MLLFLAFSAVYGELIEMGYKNYTMAKKEYQPIVILYHGQDKQSTKFLNEFISIANGQHSLQKNANFPSNINFGLVNAIQEPKLMEKTQLGSTPQILLFYSDTGKMKYGGPLNAQAFINWIKKTVRDSPQLNEYYPSSLISKWSQFVNKVNSFQLVAILVTPEFRVAPLKSFVQAAKQMTQGYVYCHIFDPEIYKHLDVDSESSQLIIYSRYEDMDGYDEEAQKRWKTHMYRFKGDVKNSDDILKFLKVYAFKKGFVYVDDTKFQKLTRRNDQLPTMILLYNKTVPEHQKYYDQMQNARYTLLNKAIIGVADVEGDIAERLDRWFAIDVNTTQLPQLIAIKPNGDDSFFKYKDGSNDPIQLYEDIVNGVQKPFYRDEGILTNLYDGAGIYKLTRSTYHEFIKESSAKGRDVVVMYTAKKCQPCKDFRPDYNDVFKRFKDDIADKVIFTRLDIELNEIDNLQIDNYPHVKLYVAGKDVPYTLHSDKTERGLMKWLGESSTYGDIFKGKIDL